MFKPIRDILGIILFFGLAGCSPQVISSTESVVSGSTTGSTSGAITVSPPSYVLTWGSSTSLPLTASGGAAPYLYRIVSGPGRIEPSSGLFDPSTLGGFTTATQTVINVTDSSGSSQQSVLSYARSLVNGSVNAFATDGTSLFLGGTFTSAYPNAAIRMATLDTSSGNMAPNFFAQFDNSVSAILVVGTQIYVGGSFTKYNGLPASRLAKIDRNTGNLDTAFTQSTGFNAGISALAVSGGSLYVGGAFSTYRNDTNTGTLPANRLAKIDLTTGNLDTSFTQSTGFSSSVTSLVVSGNSLYTGGAFTTYRNDTNTGTLPANRLAKIDLTTGNLDTTFTQSTGFGGSVTSLVVSGNSLYAGGVFATYRNDTNSGTLAANNLAKINLTTGNLDTTFTRSIGVNSTVSGLAVSGTSLYVGGGFLTYRNDTSTGTVPCQGLAKLDLTTGNLDTTFTQSTGFNANVSSLAVSGTSLYVGGGFTTYRNDTNTGTLPAVRIAKLDLVTGNLDTTFTQSSGFENTVSTLAVSGTSLYAGGSFVSYRGIPAPRLVKFRLSDWTVDTSFTQSTVFDNTVNALAISGTSLYVGGLFTTYRNNTNSGTLPCNRLAKLDLTTGNLDTIFTQSTGPNSSVNSFAISGTSLYVGGQFGTYRNNTNTGTLPALLIAKVDLTTGNLDTTFNQSIGPNNIVSTVAISGTSLYIGGAFTTYRNDTNTGTLPALNLAKVDLTTGNLDTTFTQSTGFNSATVSVLAVSGTALYAAGSFTTYRNDTNTGTLPALRLAKVDLTTGNLDTTFVQSVGLNLSASALAISGTSLYVGGAFTTYRNDTSTGTLPAQHLAKVDLTTGNLDTTFTQSTGFNANLTGLAAIGSSLFVGGFFTSYRGFNILDAASVNLTSGDPE